jgi:alpha-tubulin suppressor-like RCC1 family protein
VLGTGQPGQLGTSVRKHGGRSPGEEASRSVAGRGATHTCGLTMDGAAWCWETTPADNLAQRGTSGFTPVKLSGNTSFKSIAPALCTRAPDDAGAAWCWGSNASASSGTTRGRTPVPFLWQPRSRSDERRVKPHVRPHRFGAAYCWGGTPSLTPSGFRIWWSARDGTTTDRQVPTLVARELVFARIEAGTNFTCALTAGGRIYCWGVATHGALGDGDMKRVLGPTAYGPLSGRRRRT